ncbi:MAG: elongation factor Ts [Candidatus Komeilibacteria bacterium]|nr:elongation factor Ts [Candidatus Komeilibacteria bacterium]
MSEKDLLIKLRQQTGAGIMDIKEALQEAGDDEEKAIEFLRKKGQKIAAKRAERKAGEGWIGSYIHANGKLAALVSLKCETDFVARNADFQALAHDLAMQVVAANPIYLKPADIPADVLEKEKAFQREEVEKSGKTGDMADKIIEGKLGKFYTDVCFLHQPFFKDDKKTVAQLIEEATAKIGEKIEIEEFKRVQI